MTENLTRAHKLVEEISAQGWLANPAGRQGYEVIVLEQVGSGGNRFYGSLKPGETLRLSERLFGKFTVLAVDIRHARSVPVEGRFATYERGRKVTVRANVRYRVTDARVVAMDTVDPLGELRDKVIATLHREVALHREANLAPGTIEQIITSVGPATHLGLTVEGAELIEFTPDSRLTRQVVEEEDLRHQLNIEGIKNRAAIETQSQQESAQLKIESERQTAEIRWRQDRHQAIDLTDINVLMHDHPEMVPQIFGAFTARDQRLLEEKISLVKPAILAYIEQQKEIEGDISPDEIVRIMRQFIEPTSGRLQSPVERRKLVWGDQKGGAQTSNQSKITFSDDEQPPAKKSPSEPRIKFGD